jgi:hypothetical protein
MALLIDLPSCGFQDVRRLCVVRPPSMTGACGSAGDHYGDIKVSDIALQSFLVDNLVNES